MQCLKTITEIMKTKEHHHHQGKDEMYNINTPANIQKSETGHQATLGLVYAVPNIGMLRIVRVCILASFMEGFTGHKLFTISN